VIWRHVCRQAEVVCVCVCGALQQKLRGMHTAYAAGSQSVHIINSQVSHPKTNPAPVKDPTAV
jgi:hypothetical protein